MPPWRRWRNPPNSSWFVNTRKQVAGLGGCHCFHARILPELRPERRLLDNRYRLLSVAAITSVVGLCEPLGAWLAERFGWNRHRASVVLIGAATGVGLISVLSYNHWAEVMIFGSSLGVVMDFVPNQIFLPLGGLLIALFVGWFVSEETSREELALGNPILFAVWRNLVRYVVVPAVMIILIAGVTE